jgi:hypothetical protein
MVCLGNVVRAYMGWRIEPDNSIKMSNGDGDLEKAKSGRDWIFAVGVLKRLQLQL